MNFDSSTRQPCIVQPEAPPDPRCDDNRFAMANPALCATISTLIIRPPVASLCESDSVQFRVFDYVNSTEVDVTDSVLFGTSNVNVFAVGVNGGAGTAMSPGTVTVTAMRDSKIARATVTVLPEPCCDSLTIASAVVLDNSNSMSTDFNGGTGGQFPSRLHYAKAVADAYAGVILAVEGVPKDSVKVWSLAETIEDLTTDYLSDTAELTAAIEAVPQTLEQTNLLLAVTTAADELLLSEADRKILVIISDGQHTTTTEQIQQIIDEATAFKTAGGIIITIGVRATGTGYDLLERICTIGFFLNGLATNPDDVLAWLRYWKDILCVGECLPAGDIFVNQPQLNFSSLDNWFVEDGQVHLLGPGLLDLQPGNGLYLDMAGGSPATIRTIDQFTLVADCTYRITFRLAGNQRVAITGQSLKVYVRDVDAADEDPNLFEAVVGPGHGQPFQTFGFAFRAPVEMNARLWFEQLYQGTPPTKGNLLDSVKFECSTTLEVLLEDDFDSENEIYIPPRCGPSAAVAGLDNPGAPEIEFADNDGEQIGLNVVPLGSAYDGSGIFNLAVIVGNDYLWIGTGLEDALNDGNPVSSGVAFTALATPLVLNGPAGLNVSATVKRANTSLYQYSKYTYGYSWLTNFGETGITPAAYNASDDANVVEFLATARKITLESPPESVTAVRLWRSLGEGHTLVLADAGTAAANGIYLRINDKRWEQDGGTHYLAFVIGGLWTLYDSLNTALYTMVAEDFPGFAGTWVVAGGAGPAPVSADLTFDSDATEVEMFLLAELPPSQTIYLDNEDREFFEARYDSSVSAPTENTTVFGEGDLGFGYAYCCDYGIYSDVGNANLAPVMSDYNVPEGYLVSENPDTVLEASSPAWEAFDGVTDPVLFTGWNASTSVTAAPIPAGERPWLQMQFPEAHRISAYRLSTNGNLSTVAIPRSWILYGSNDGVDFTIIDSVTDYGVPAFELGAEARFEVAPEATYSIYRFEVVRHSGGDTVNVSELQFEGLTDMATFSDECDDCLEGPPVQLPDLDAALLDIESGATPTVTYTSTKQACFECPEGFLSVPLAALEFTVLTNIAAGTGPWSQIVRMADPTQIAGHYALVGYENAVGLCGPKDFLFQGTNDELAATDDPATAWTTLDTEVDQAWVSGLTRRYHLQGQTTAYKYYRLYITEFACGSGTVAEDFDSLTSDLLHASGVNSLCIGATQQSKVSQSHADQLAFAAATQGAQDAFFATYTCLEVWRRTVTYGATCEADSVGSGSNAVASASYTSLISEGHALQQAERIAREAAVAALACE